MPDFSFVISGFFIFRKYAIIQTGENMMKKNETAQKMMDFIARSPTSFHAIHNLKTSLLENGFCELLESKKWEIEAGKNYFVTRNNSALIAFKIPAADFRSFLITASHSDSPSFKVKENPEIKSLSCTVLNVEKYGGMLCAPWFDRPLSVAGRIAIAERDSGRVLLKQKLVNIDRDLLLIPNLAIHMNRDANSGTKYTVQNDMLPVLSLAGGTTLADIVAENAGIEKERISSADLFLYNRDRGTFWGADNEFIASPRLDDLECAYASAQAFIQAENPAGNATVLAVFDNEEVGSGTQQGADSTFLEHTLRRINSALGRDSEDYYTEIAQSFMVSADNAHAAHPHFADKADPVNRPALNNGIVIKFNAAQKYTTDAVSAAIFEAICKNADVPYQIFTNRSDIAGGSTLGNISTAHVSLKTVDIGLAQWAMHSPMESAGAKDVEYLVSALSEFYRTDVQTQE